MRRLFKTLSGINGYSLFTTFFVCGLFGWFFETAAVFAQTGSLTRRGLLFYAGSLGQLFSSIRDLPGLADLPVFWGLPVIVIYGVGGVLVPISLKKFSNPLAIFVLGALLATLLEFLASFFCEIVLQRQFWEYSGEFLNFQGRICLRSSIAWGLISIFVVKILIPKAYFVYSKEIRLPHHTFIYNVLIAYTAFCILVKYFVRP
ncbi:MAG TPA: putative ABC transporter permease [Treponemataceae bacterium]|nr:putative ABC transporter permease [Treponemataceae bacterium]